MAYSPMSPDRDAKMSHAWILQEGCAVITKSDTVEHMRENLDSTLQIEEDIFPEKNIKTITNRQ